MKKLEHDFVAKHLDDHFLIGINALYWRNTDNASISKILGRQPVFSESFYSKYGNFEPLAKHIAIENIKSEKCSLVFLDKTVDWGNYVIDIISYFRMNTDVSYKLLNKILKKFKLHFIRVENLSVKTFFPRIPDIEPCEIRKGHKKFQELQAEIEFDFGNEKPLILFQFKIMSEIYQEYSGFKLAYILGPKIDDDYA